MKSKLDEMIISNTRFRHMMLADPFRPGYHFAIPEDYGIPGDPNGAFFAGGRYHLMYLYKPYKHNSNCEDRPRWGHVSSIDLVHWRSHPDALFADETDGGIYSGGAFVDDDGSVYLTYWALPSLTNTSCAGGLRIARNLDSYYDKWEKLPNYIVKCTENGVSEADGKLIGCIDPSNIWKRDNLYYVQSGNIMVLIKHKEDPDALKEMLGDWVELFRSKDLNNWEYVHRFYARNPQNVWTHESEDNACPSFLPLYDKKSGGKLSGKYLELFISHNMGCQYYIGHYDTKNNVFLPEKHGRMSWADKAFFAPEALIDSQNRHIMWAWFKDNIADESKRGWSGAYSLPRILWLNCEGNLGIAPADELKTLRYNKKIFARQDLKDGNALNIFNPLSCEIYLEADRIKNFAGIKIFIDGEPEAYTLIYCDKTNKKLILDTSKGTKEGFPNVEVAPFELADTESLKMTIYVDKSVIEVFVNERQAIARRVYPNNIYKTKIALHGKCRIKKLIVWDIMPSNFY